MTTQHTPGPWRFTTDAIAIWNSAAAKKTLCIADMGSEGSPDIDYAETLANARLIAAAPIMLLALKEMLRTNDASCVGEGCQISGIDLARAAIAKATGETA